MIVKEGQIFNLYDTNGRRKDIINAIQIYITILYDLLNNQNYTWNRLPQSSAQYIFYKRVLEQCSDVFTEHDPYDKLQEELANNPEFLEALNSNNISWIYNHADQYKELIKLFDNGIEDRARHYTSNLAKLGFSDDDRNISQVGKILVDQTDIEKDTVEKYLPINDINLIYLRQCLKLKLFDKDTKKFYSPFLFAIYMLLRNERMSEDLFFELVQGGNPFLCIQDIDVFLQNYELGMILHDNVAIPPELKIHNKLPFDTFKDYFKNKKSGNIINIYYSFYEKIYEFVSSRTQDSINNLLTFYEAEKDKLNKAFGFGRNIFKIRTGERPDISFFVENYPEYFNGNINEIIYKKFYESKKNDLLREYSDTTKRIFKATGLISFENGYVELEFKEICKYVFNPEKIKAQLFGVLTETTIDEYEQFIYQKVLKISEIFEYSTTELDEVSNAIIEGLPELQHGDIKHYFSEKRNFEFTTYIEEKYPIERVQEILGLFSDRSNDSVIKAAVCPEATVPTIYEYMVGIAWYYFSGKSINLLESLNMTLSANFEPLLHAGGGQGDIVIQEHNRVIMLEVTLMNANTQKRGEWEPVLRHSVNLKIEEESRGSGKDVITYFIADSFDANTINIWKAISTIPLESSLERGIFTKNVIIMPINTNELSNLLNEHSRYNEIIDKTKELFHVEDSDFDLDWRTNFIEQLL